MFDQFYTALKTNSDNQLVRKDMDVSEQERLANCSFIYYENYMEWIWPFSYS